MTEIKSKIKNGDLVCKWALSTCKGIVMEVLERDAGTPYVEARVQWLEPNERIGYCLLSALEKDVRAFAEKVQITGIKDGAEAYVSESEDDESVWVHMKVKRSQVLGFPPKA